MDREYKYVFEINGTMIRDLNDIQKDAKVLIFS